MWQIIQSRPFTTVPIASLTELTVLLSIVPSSGTVSPYGSWQAWPLIGLYAVSTAFAPVIFATQPVPVWHSMFPCGSCHIIFKVTSPSYLVWQASRSRYQFGYGSFARATRI